MFLLSAAHSFALRTPAIGGSGHLHARSRFVALCAKPAVSEMKLKEIKAELDSLSVTWKGVCFEREDLEQALVAARQRGPSASSEVEEATPTDAGAGAAPAAAPAPEPAPTTPPRPPQPAPPRQLWRRCRWHLHRWRRWRLHLWCSRRYRQRRQRVGIK